MVRVCSGSLGGIPTDVGALATVDENSISPVALCIRLENALCLKW